MIPNPMKQKSCRSITSRNVIAAVILFIATAMDGSVHGLEARAAMTTGPLRATEENNAAVEALRRNKYDAAIAHLRLARSIEPANSTVRRNLISALNARAKEAYDAGRWDDAERDLVEALSLAPGDEETIGHFAAFLNNRAVAAMGERRLGQARGLFERALKYLPQVTDAALSSRIKINYATLLTSEGDALALAQQVEQARARYNEALAYHSGNAAALAGLADLDYDNDEYAAALQGYQKAMEAAVRPDDGKLRSTIAERMETLRKEIAIESDFLTIHDQADRFRVFFPKDLAKGAVARVLQTLDEAFNKVGRDLDFRSSRPLTVKIYSRAQLNTIQQIPSLVVGFFDGKIRLLDERLLADTAKLRSSVFHEYAHAAIHLRGGEAVPSWLHEGLAQIESPEKLPTQADVHYWATRVRTRQTATLDELTRPFDSNQPEDRMALVYRQSKAWVEFLLARGGWDRVRHLLGETARLGDFEAAFMATFGMTTVHLESEWKRWVLDRDAGEEVGGEK